MRVFEVYDSTSRKRGACAILEYDASADEMRININPEAKPAKLPFMLALFAERGEFEIPDEWARKWVRERIPPEGRQNLGEILRKNGLDQYDEIELLAAAEGRSAQDDFLVREVQTTQVNYAFVSLGDGERQPESRASDNEWCRALGPEIASIRKSIGMTQRELSEKTGIDQAAISRIESGRANPTLNTLNALVGGVGRNLMVRII